MTIVHGIDFNSQKHYLGKLCKKEHDYDGTGQSLKFRSNDQCWHCKKGYMEAYDRSLVPKRKAQREQELALIQPKLVDLVEYDEDKLRLGGLCSEKHNFRNTGQSLRYKSNRNCFFCTQEQGVQNYAQNRDARLEQRRKHKEENREAVLARRRQYKKENREMFRRLDARYRSSPRVQELIKSYTKKYNQSEKGKLNAIRGANRRRARMHEAISEPYSLTDINARKAFFGDCCAYCGTHKSQLITTIELDHVVPIARKGADRINNLVPACIHCNSSKNASNLAVWYIKQNFATLERFAEVISVLGDEELIAIGMHKIEEAFKFFEQN